MGISYSLTEERIMDKVTGRYINADLENYKLPRIGDIGELVGEMYQPDEQYDRGVVGLGEPPVISTGAAISNAVANAIGVRVPVLPMTPQACARSAEGSAKHEFVRIRQSPHRNRSARAVERSRFARQRRRPGRGVLAGGTDLVSLLQHDLLAPRRVVDLKNIVSRCRESATRGRRSDRRTDDAGGDGRSPLLAPYDRCNKSSSGSTQSRFSRAARSAAICAICPTAGTSATVTACSASKDGKSLVEAGDNRYHAILGNRGPAKFVSASRFAPALIAWGRAGAHHRPGSRARRMAAARVTLLHSKIDSQGVTVLKPGQLISHVWLPDCRLDQSAILRSSATAGTGLAAGGGLRLRGAGRGIRPRSANRLGHVAPVPWVADTRGRSLTGQSINEETAEAAGEAAVEGATPLANNGYKVKCARSGQTGVASAPSASGKEGLTMSEQLKIVEIGDVPIPPFQRDVCQRQRSGRRSPGGRRTFLVRPQATNLRPRRKSVTKMPKSVPMLLRGALKQVSALHPGA